MKKSSREKEMDFMCKVADMFADCHDEYEVMEMEQMLVSIVEGEAENRAYEVEKDDEEDWEDEDFDDGLS